MVKPRVGPDRDVSSEMASARLIYILYLVGILAGITTLIGLVLAYSNNSKLKTLGPKDGAHWIRSHFGFQIRTFWILLLYMIVGLTVLSTVIGETAQTGVYLGWLALVIVYVVRCAKGMSSLAKGKAHPNPKSWLFG